MPEPSFPTAVSMRPIEEPSLTPAQAAEYLKCSVASLAVWRSTKKGPEYTKVGSSKKSCILYRKMDLDNFQNNRKPRGRPKKV